MKQIFYSHQKMIGGPAYDESKTETTRQPRADFGDDHPGISAITTHLS